MVIGLQYIEKEQPISWLLIVSHNLYSMWMHAWYVEVCRLGACVRQCVFVCVCVCVCVCVGYDGF